MYFIRYYMICWGLTFSVIRINRITENFEFSPKDIKGFACQKKNKLYFNLVFIYTAIKVKSKRGKEEILMHIHYQGSVHHPPFSLLASNI